jgi:hypothetical protein
MGDDFTASSHPLDRKQSLNCPPVSWRNPDEDKAGEILMKKVLVFLRKCGTNAYRYYRDPIIGAAFLLALRR